MSIMSVMATSPINPLIHSSGIKFQTREEDGHVLSSFAPLELVSVNYSLLPLILSLCIMINYTLC